MLKKQIVDQSAHAAAAIVLLAPILLCPGSLAGCISGFGAGLIREITEGGNVFSRGSCLDLLFWSIGGGCAGALFH